MKKYNECCGTCNYNMWDPYNEVFYCDNKDSDYYGCETEYSTTCEEYEEK